MIRTTIVVALVLVLGLAFSRGNGEASTSSANALSPAQTASARAIRQTFGRYSDQALRVSWCESRFYPTARNGQYLGIFQMGAWERRTYGHGSSATAQARAAYRYFVASGSDWSPWSCKPW